MAFEIPRRRAGDDCADDTQGRARVAQDENEDGPRGSPQDTREAQGRRVRQWVPVACLGLILILAAALRFVGIGSKSLWLDEAVTAEYAAAAGLGAAARRIAAIDTHPPLYSLVVHVWVRLVNSRRSRAAGTVLARFGSEAMLRTPTAICGVISVALLYLIARRLFDNRLALVAALVQACSCHAVYFSQEARCYAMLAALVLGMHLVLLRMAASERVRWGDCAGYAVLAAAALYTLQVSILVIVTHWLLFLILVRRSAANLLRGVATQVAIGLAYLPWVPFVLNRRVFFEPQLRLVGAARPITFADVCAATREWTLGPLHLGGEPRLERALMVVACLAVLVGVGTILWRVWRGRGNVRDRAGASTSERSANDRTALVFLSASFFLPIAGFLLIPGPRIHEFESKHLVFLQPVCVLAVVAALRGRRAVGLAGVAIVLAANAAWLWQYHGPRFQKERWQEVVAETSSAERPGDVYLFTPRYVRTPFAYYYLGRQQLDQRALARKQRALVPDPLHVNAPILQPATTRARRIRVVYAYSSVARPSQVLKRWLDAHWRYLGGKEYPGFLGAVGWWLYEKDALARDRASGLAVCCSSAQ